MQLKHLATIHPGCSEDEVVYIEAENILFPQQVQRQQQLPEASMQRNCTQ